MLDGKAYADVLNSRVDAVYAQTRDALQAVMNELNYGQRQKLMKIDTVRAILERYGVETGKQEASE